MTIAAFPLAVSVPVGITSPAGAECGAGVAVYALSRGAGVPESTQKALERVRSLFETARREGRVLRIEEKRIGLEGEKRLCAEPRDAETGSELLAQVRNAVTDVELLNVIEESCSSQPEGRPL